ncbi:MAG: hypothetical protein U9O64_04840 [Campylobacterota bacterium]|nr:hypothetical protein [Campylobacterota bacterium]
MKIRVYAKMFQTGTPGWDVKVIDNTNSNALYVMEGALALSGDSDSQRNLNASSGWSGSSYGLPRTAAPFAILNNAYKSMQKVLTADANTVFPSLLINWSVNNVSLVGDTSIGHITTSHYTNGNLFILGDADSDTDEYDDHVVTHEWGHYYEDKFSRSDSIGGGHGEEDHLDIRVALGEGWGNAFSAMALDNPIYFDTLDTAQTGGFYFDVESGTSINKGWYSESSIQRILYDIYDENEDGNDILSLGFTPIHEVFTGAEKTTEAFTSLFTFITLLKEENPANIDEIERIVASENIAPITDIYGTGRMNQSTAYPYHDLTLGVPLEIEINNEYGTYNKLNNRQYVKFNIISSALYSIKVEQINGTNSDPDFYLFASSPFSQIDFSESTISGLEQKDITLPAGEYLLDISDYNNIDSAQLRVSIGLK